MDQVQQQIMDILSRKGVDDHEEYQLRMNRQEMMSELSLSGTDKEAADEALEKLCAEGILAMDETSVYQYDEPAT